MKYLLRNIVIGVMVFLGTQSLIAQDIHFSQYFLTPTYLNPATAGTFTGDYRGMLNFKEQYSAFNKAYRTYHVSYDMPITQNGRYKALGGGVNLYQDIAGDSKTKMTSFKASLSQTIQFASYADITLGISLGYTQFAADYSNLTWDAQWDGIVYDERLPTQEIFFGRNQGVFDFSAGLFYRYFDYDGFPYEIGFAVDHLSTPSVGVLNVQDEIPMKFTFHGKKEFEMYNERWGIIGILFASRQRKAMEINGGGLLRYDVGLHSKYTGYYKNTTIYFGASYRWGDAIIPKFLINLKERYTLGLSYDVNISPLITGSRYRGGLEVSFLMSGFFSQGYRVISPVTF